MLDNLLVSHGHMTKVSSRNFVNFEGGHKWWSKWLRVAGIIQKAVGYNNGIITENVSGFKGN
jgi:hypothetical protein